MSTFAPRTLNAAGQCCGRKPLGYKLPAFHFFCCRCNASYNPHGHQIENWAWKSLPDGFEPTFPDHEYTKMVRA